MDTAPAAVHRAVVVSIEGRRILADAGFPLPVLLPLDPPAQEIPTGFGSVSVAAADAEGARVTCDARGEVAELLRLFPAPGPGVASRKLRVEESGAGSRLSIHPTLAGAGPPAGPGEAVRKTLVFHLVSELFELSRG
jgi:hypothetical protein